MLATIKVLPNPYLHLDENGKPAHVIPVDPTTSTARAFVGAVLSNAEVVDNYPVGELLSARQFNTWTFSQEPVEVLYTQYYRAAVRDGSLICADDSSAKRCEVSFVPVAKAFEQYKAEAANKWKNQYGEFPDWYSPAKPAKTKQVEV